MGIRTLLDIFCLSFLLSLAGVVIDADHPVAALLGIAEMRFLHYDPVFCFLYSIICGFTAAALAIRWLDLRLKETS